jgi:hypothetical protein
MNSLKQERDPNQIRRACTRSLTGHYRQMPRQILSALAETAGPDEWGDMYGSTEKFCWHVWTSAGEARNNKGSVAKIFKLIK